MEPGPVERLVRLLEPVYRSCDSPPDTTLVAQEIARRFPPSTTSWNVALHHPVYLFAHLGLEPTELEVVTIGVNDQTFIIEIGDEGREQVVRTAQEWKVAHG